MEFENDLKKIKTLFLEKDYKKSDELCKEVLKNDENNNIAWKYRALNIVEIMINIKFEEKKLYKVINFVNKSLQGVDDKEKEEFIDEYIDKLSKIKDNLHKEIDELPKERITEGDYRTLAEKCIVSITILNILFGLKEDKKYLQEILSIASVYKKMYKSDNKKIRFALKEEDFYKYKDIVEDTNNKLKKIDNEYKIKNAPNDYEAYVKDVMGGCYIATAVYGDYDAKEVIKLRKFRDEVLDKYILGRGFIKIYYKFSPFFANKIGSDSYFSKNIKLLLDKLIIYLEKKER